MKETGKVLVTGYRSLDRWSMFTQVQTSWSLHWPKTDRDCRTLGSLGGLQLPPLESHPPDTHVRLSKQVRVLRDNRYLYIMPHFIISTSCSCSSLHHASLQVALVMRGWTIRTIRSMDYSTLAGKNGRGTAQPCGHPLQDCEGSCASQDDINRGWAPDTMSAMQPWPSA